MTSSCCASIFVLKETYEIPDQVDTVTIESTGQQSSSVEIIKSETQIKDSLAVNVGVETAKVSFSASSSYAKMQVRC